MNAIGKLSILVTSYSCLTLTTLKMTFDIDLTKQISKKIINMP